MPTIQELIIEKQKTVANIVLDRLEIIDPTCILAGGAPRDWWLGRSANDLDFYVYSRGSAEDYKKQLMGVGLHGEILQPQGINARADREAKYGAMAGLESVHEMIYQGEKIQIMRMREPTFRGVVDQFGCSLSKVWYKHGQLRPTSEADNTRRFEVGYFPQSYPLTQRYVQKMIERFPEYNWIFGKEAWQHYIRTARSMYRVL